MGRPTSIALHHHHAPEMGINIKRMEEKLIFNCEPRTLRAHCCFRATHLQSHGALRVMRLRPMHRANTTNNIPIASARTWRWWPTCSVTGHAFAFQLGTQKTPKRTPSPRLVRFMLAQSYRPPPPMPPKSPNGIKL